MTPNRLLPDAPFATYADYRAATGADAVARARGQTPEELIATLKSAGLRGRGGAGFPAGVKWDTLAHHPCPTRYVVCNAAEGEPGTFKDRWLIRLNPYATLEGMAIAAHVVGAGKVYVATKARFAPELARLEAAIEELQAAGTFAGLEVALVRGPDEYLFGEEKALLNVIEGIGPLPREAHRPPYEMGLYATPGSPNPALMNNAETFAHVPDIVRNGALAFRGIGTDDTPGTCIYTVCGDVRRPGVYELEAGVSLRDLFYDVAGGPRDGRTLRGALSGVASGVIPAAQFDTPAEFGALAAIGAGLGSAGFMVFDDATHPARVMQAVARFLYVESCSQCTPCKTGLGRASEGLDALVAEGGTDADLERALQGARSAPQANRCYLPVQGSRLVPSFVAAFPEVAEDLKAGAVGGAPWPLPKLVDYDPEAHRFTYDDKQQYKQPDWTYALPAEAEAAPA